MNISERQIDDIAQDLSSGMICYIHKETNAIKALFDESHEYYADLDMDLWGDEIREVQDNLEKYIKIEKWSTHEAFRFMVDFVQEVDNPKIKERLTEALNRGKPFRNFRRVVDNQGDIDQQWFEYRDKRQREWVRRYLRNIELQKE